MVINNNVGTTIDKRVEVTKWVSQELKTYSGILEESKYKILAVNYDIEQPSRINILVYDGNKNSLESELNRSDLEVMLPRTFRQDETNIPITISYGKFV